MANEINRKCLYCGHRLQMDSYKMNKMQVIAYCDNDDCPVKPCTESTYPTKVYQELLAISESEVGEDANYMDNGNSAKN